MPESRPLDEDGSFLHEISLPRAVDSNPFAHIVAFEEILQNFVRLGADNGIAANKVRRHGGDAELTRKGPIGVNRLFAYSGIKDLSDFVPG